MVELSLTILPHKRQGFKMSTLLKFTTSSGIVELPNNGLCRRRMSSGITGCSHYQLIMLWMLLLQLLRGMMTIVQMLLGRSTTMGNHSHILLIGVDITAAAVVVATATAAAAAAVIIVQVTVG